MDIEVYCPEEILGQSGPLFGDTQTIQHKWDEFVTAKLCGNRIESKCTICGYPDCECDSCNVLNRARASGTKTKSTSGHTCALRYSALGAPRKGGHYDLELHADLRDAWASKGVLCTPSFVKGKGYFWPEEL